MPISRIRSHYFLFIILTIGIGLLSRTSIIPTLIYPYLGDVIYGLLFYLIIGFLFPKWSMLQVVLTSIIMCFAIEFSQLCQADWLNKLRSYRLGGLILGYTFVWSDLICYTLGGFLGYWIEIKFWQKK